MTDFVGEGVPNLGDKAKAVFQGAVDNVTDYASDVKHDEITRRQAIRRGLGALGLGVLPGVLLGLKSPSQTEKGAGRCPANYT